MAAARERLVNSQADLAHGHLAGAASAAYYAMLYAARAALSERNQHAKTHSGVWGLFGQELVDSGEFGSELARRVRRAQAVRELGDYEAKPPSRAEAEELMATASAFIDAVERALKQP